MSEKQQRLVLSIIDFLNQSIEDGTVKQDDKESLEVAVQCIGEAFGVDPSNQEQVGRLSVKPATLPTIFDVFLKTKDKLGSGSGLHPSPAPPTPASPPKRPSAEEKAKADKFKQEGNAQMSAKQYDKAIEAYTQAIEIDALNPVYYSNRAAAYSSKGDHLSAIDDAERAIEVDPSFVKAYHRLGHAQYSISDYKAAAAAFRRGLELDPTNSGLKSGLQNAEARIDAEPSESSPVPRSPPAAGGAPGAGGLADMMRNLGGLGGPGGPGGGGMPDIASLMNNPQMMQMAQQMMANGGLEGLMNNPAVANMV
ncbi:hypothetical protein EVG20_g1880 [Dentipellis fragilis]|uniref:SGTA homodimerisation domain-containing protein n=1 Tax=Dentipellis fragilis TaxID=205917 RepID=A0A4Y9Z8M1_9AGAM|nr:hypothetical protein EVG20_g1880 [Dentipellis fragilis]